MQICVFPFCPPAIVRLRNKQSRLFSILKIFGNLFVCCAKNYIRDSFRYISIQKLTKVFPYSPNYIENVSNPLLRPCSIYISAC